MGGSSQVLTAVLCGLTRISVDNLAHQFANSCQRLRWATEGLDQSTAAAATLLQLLPGSGASEAACIKMLEGRAVEREHGESSANLPLYFKSSWISDESILGANGWRVCVYQAFAKGLKKYLTRCIMNGKPGLGFYRALIEAEDMIREAGGEGEFGLDSCDVLDVAASKKGSWRRAVHLLETMFLSKRVSVTL